jgi:hypothetical protein
MPRWLLLGTLLIGALLLGLAVRWGLDAHRNTAFDTFWAPMITPKQPVLICVSKAIALHPVRHLYDDYAKTHPGEFESEWQRMSRPLSLPQDQVLRWNDLEVQHEYGVASGDVYSAVQLALAFAHMKKDSQIRIGKDYQFEDIRKSPSVLIGAFNNRWTMQVGASLPLRFFENGDSMGIEETHGQKRRWRGSSIGGGRTKDYALVARLLDAETGQSLIILGGINTGGTQAATEFVTNPKYLTPALTHLQSGWENQSIAFVLQTTVTDDVAGPPEVVAATTW